MPPSLSDLLLWPRCRGGITGNQGFLSPPASSCGRAPSLPAAVAAAEQCDGWFVGASAGERRRACRQPDVGYQEVGSCLNPGDEQYLLSGVTFVSVASGR